MPNASRYSTGNGDERRERGEGRTGEGGRKAGGRTRRRMRRSSGIMNAGLTVLLLLATRSELVGCEFAIMNHHGLHCSLPTILKLRGGRTEDKDMAMTQLDDIGVDALDDEFDAAFREVESRARPQRAQADGAQTGQLARSSDDVLEKVERLVLQHDLDAAELVRASTVLGGSDCCYRCTWTTWK